MLFRSSEVLARNERNLNIGLAATCFAVAAFAARFPRLLSWPLAFLLAAGGATSVARVFRPRHPRPQRSVPQA